MLSFLCKARWKSSLPQPFPPIGKFGVWESLCFVVYGVKGAPNPFKHTYKNHTMKPRLVYYQGEKVLGYSFAWSCMMRCGWRRSRWGPPHAKAFATWDTGDVRPANERCGLRSKDRVLTNKGMPCWTIDRVPFMCTISLWVRFSFPLISLKQADSSFGYSNSMCKRGPGDGEIYEAKFSSTHK